MKIRKTPHPILVPSVPEAFDGFNVPADHPVLGHYQKLDRAWYQRRRSISGIVFQIRGYGDLTDEDVTAWFNLERTLSEYIDTALEEMPPPWEAPDEFNCDELVLETVRMRGSKFELWFDGPYCRKNHETPIAYFSEGAFVEIEWGN